MKQVRKNDNNLAITYYRYSSHAQNDMSIEQQREQAVKYAEAHGYTIVKEYEDRAISGTTDERPQFLQMLSEVGKIKPAVLILWKTDRLGRDRFVLANSKRIIREAGCSIKYVAESVDTETPEGAFFEGILESMAEFYSKQLRQNVMRGMQYNAENALYNGHKTLGYTVDDTKHYVIDDVTAPIVINIYKEYADGKPLTEIAKGLNDAGIRTTLGRDFNVNGLRHILKNDAYIGVYKYGDVVIKDGMPRIISDELFSEVQKRFERNKHRAKEPSIDSEEPRYWLTGKLYCGECGSTIHGMSGTSKQGKIHYYYACKRHRKGQCKLRNIKKYEIEALVIKVLREFLNDTENLMSLSVDVSNYYKKLNTNDGYLKSLEVQMKDTEKKIKELMKFVESGRSSETIFDRIVELEGIKANVAEAIEAEKVKLSISNDEYSIQHYFEMYANADFDDDETRDTIFEYFIDKIYVYDDRLVITWYYSDNKSEVALDELTDITNAESISNEKGSTLTQSAPLDYVKSNPMFDIVIYKNIFALVSKR